MNTKKIKTQYVFSKDNTVSILINAETNIWSQVNFQWIPIAKLNKSMSK